MSEPDTRSARLARHRRVRQKIAGVKETPRLCVFRSLNNIYAQVIDDTNGQTLVSASSLDAEIKAQLTGKNKSARAAIVGAYIAKRAKKQGIRQAVFDRGGYKYQGRVKALAEEARKTGLKL